MGERGFREALLEERHFVREYIRINVDPTRCSLKAVSADVVGEGRARGPCLLRLGRGYDPRVGFEDRIQCLVVFGNHFTITLIF